MLETANSGDFTTQNDFRRVALIRDPKSGGSTATVTTLRATRAVRFSGTHWYIPSRRKNYTNKYRWLVGKVVQYDVLIKSYFTHKQDIVMKVLTQMEIKYCLVEQMLSLVQLQMQQEYLRSC